MLAFLSCIYPRNLQEQSSGVESQPQSQVAWQHEIAGLLVNYVKTAGGELRYPVISAPGNSMLPFVAQ